MTNSMDYNDIPTAIRLKDDYDKLKRIQDAMRREESCPLYVTIWNNSERLELPKSVAEKIGVLIRQEMLNTMDKIKQL